MSPATSVLAVHHSDVPFAVGCQSGYPPQIATVLNFLATAILHVHPFSHVLKQKQARDRSHVEPVYGLAEGTEGALVGLGSNGSGGVVLEMEYRRKSGREVKEWFFLPPPSSTDYEGSMKADKAPEKARERIILLEDHPSFSIPTDRENLSRNGEDIGTTFSLTLTDKQKRERGDVILPYFDAQHGDGSGQGGRILYEMGVEDDFDDEEDEI